MMMGVRRGGGKAIAYARPPLTLLKHHDRGSSAAKTFRVPQRVLNSGAHFRGFRVSPKRHEPVPHRARLSCSTPLMGVAGKGVAPRCVCASRPRPHGCRKP